MAYVLNSEKQLIALRMLAGGGSINETARQVGIHRDTCTRLMVRFGEACRMFLDREMRDLNFGLVQVDEIWTFCRKKQFRVTGLEPDAERIGSFFIYVAFDKQSRLVPAYRVDRRNKAATSAFMFDLADRLKIPKAHDSDDHRFHEGKYTPIVRIVTDGYQSYVDAVDDAFGPYAEFAQLIKFRPNKKTLILRRRKRTGNVRHRDISTSLVERHNLTMRTFMRRLARRSSCYSKKLENLEAATATYMACYNYCWRVETIKTSPAAKYGLTNRVWKFSELYYHLRERWHQCFLD